MKRVTAAELLADAERRTVHDVWPTLIDAMIEQSSDGLFVVYALWSSVDRPRGVGIVVRTRKLAERLQRAVQAGVAITVDRVMRDVKGNTYVQENRVVRARTLNADLKRLGY